MAYEQAPQVNPEKKKTVIETMRDEVLEIIGDDGKRFGEAFAKVAHTHGIFFTKDRAQYNYHYGAVEKKVNARLESVRRDQAKGTLNPSARDNYEPLIEHPVLGDNQ